MIVSFTLSTQTFIPSKDLLQPRKMRSNFHCFIISLFIPFSSVLHLVNAAGDLALLETDPSAIAKRCPFPTADEPASICGRPRPTETASSGPTVQSYTVNDPEKYPNKISVKIAVPDKLNDEKAYNDALVDNLKSNLPNTLQQLQVDPAQIPALAEEGLPLLFEAITAVQNGSSLPDDPGSETA